MKIEITQNGSETIASIQGPLDGVAIASQRGAADLLAETSGESIILDLKNTPFLDVSGIGLMVNVLKRTAAQGRLCKIINAVGQPFELLAALSLTSVFQIEERASVKDPRQIIVAATTTDTLQRAA